MYFQRIVILLVACALLNPQKVHSKSRGLHHHRSHHAKALSAGAQQVGDSRHDGIDSSTSSSSEASAGEEAQVQVKDDDDDDVSDAGGAVEPPIVTPTLDTATLSEPATTTTTTTPPPTTTTQGTATDDSLNTVVVQTTAGKIRGRFTDVEDGSEITQITKFLGVRFAEPPVGEKRYKPPEAAKPWEGIVNTLEYKPNCYQWRDESFASLFLGEQPFPGTEMWNSNTGVSEDCLFLNVWTPVTDFSKDHYLTVMVWIYGGGFYSGSSSLDVYNGQWLAATENVVVVSLNYRVAALGFLAFDDVDIQGNAGLYDQRMALQWVQDNIRSFGGDPASVTLFGESAGGASTSIHLVSPKSRHLFKNVIIQSGSVLSPWSMLPKSEAVRRSTKLAAVLRCNETHPEENEEGDDEDERKRKATVRCLQNAEPQFLVNQEMYMESYGTFRFPNAPVASDDFISQDPKDEGSTLVIPDDVNVMVGYNANEGNYFLVYGSPGFKLDNSNINYDHFKQGLESAMKNPLGDNVPPEISNLMVEYVDYVYTQGKRPETMDHQSKCSRAIGAECDSDIVAHLTGKTPNDTFYRDRLDDMVGDVAVVCPLLRLASTATMPPGNKKRKIFFYHFVQRSSENPWPKWMGVMHGYEIEFVFGLPLDKKRTLYSETERRLARDMMRQWANFAKHGDPNGPDEVGPSQRWYEYNHEDRCINVIGDNGSGTSMTSFLTPMYAKLNRHCSFWNDYFPQLYRLALFQPQKISTTTTQPPRTSMTSTNGGARYESVHGGARRSYPKTLLAMICYYVLTALASSLFS